MIYAQLVAKILFQAIDDLGGQGNLRQEIQHLFAFIDGFLNQLDVDLRLTTGGNTMEQDWPLLVKACFDLIIGPLLRFSKLDGRHFHLRLEFLETAHFTLINLKNTFVGHCL